MQKTASFRDMLHALVEPKVRRWVESQGMELGPFHPSQMRGSYKDWLDDQKFEDMQTDIMRLAASEDDTPIKILKGINRAAGGDWNPGMQQQAEELRNSFAQVAPYFQRWSPQWWDTLHGSTGSSATLAAAIADTHRYDDDMTAEKAVETANNIIQEIYEDPMKHRGFSAAQIGELYRQGAKRGLWHHGQKPSEMIDEMTPIIGVASALRDTMPDGYDRDDMAGIFNAFDVISPRGYYGDYASLEKQIRTSKQLNRMGGPMGAVVQRMGGIQPGPGMPTLSELEAQHAQLSQQAAMSPMMDMMAATRRMTREGLLKPDSQAQSYMSALSDRTQPDEWASMMESSGIPRELALTILNQRGENLRHVDQDMVMALRGQQGAIDHAPQLRAVEQRYGGPDPINKSILAGEKTRLAQNWGYDSWKHYNALHGPHMKQLPSIHGEARNKADHEKSFAGHFQSSPTSRVIDLFKDHPKPTARGAAASFLGGIPKMSRDATVAVDLDGTLAKQMKPYDNNKIGDPRPGAKDAMDELKEKKCKIIINTVRGNKKLVSDWLKEHEIPYDHINENPDQPPGASHKPLADVYIDDRAVDARPSWRKVMEKVRPRIKISSAGAVPSSADPGNVTIVERSVDPETWASLGGQPGQDMLTTPMSQADMVQLATDKLKPGMYVNDDNSIVFAGGTQFPKNMEAREYGINQGVAEEDLPMEMFRNKDETLQQLLEGAELMGSRGRAIKYGRPEPEGRDYDYVRFTDDQEEQEGLKELLRSLQDHGYRIKDRPGGFMTATSPDQDISVYPTAKRDQIHRAWELIESGMSKDEAWDQIEKQGASPMTWALGGAGLGGAMGLATALDDFDEDAEEYNDRWYNLLRNTAVGAGLGGATAVGLRQGLRWLTQNPPPSARVKSPTKTQTTTLREFSLEDRYKDAPGGLDEAIRRAQKHIPAGRKYGLQDWKPSAVDKPVLLSTWDTPGESTGGERGFAFPPAEAAAVAAPGHKLEPGTMPFDVAEHELTHAAMRPSIPKFWKDKILKRTVIPYAQRKNRTANVTIPLPKNIEVPEGMRAMAQMELKIPRSAWDYVASPEEFKAFSAKIKRDYVQEFGKHVDTPREAEKAINWWLNKNEGDLEQQFPAVVKHIMEDPREKKVLIQQLLQLVLDPKRLFAVSKTAADVPPPRIKKKKTESLDWGDTEDMRGEYYYVPRNRFWNVGVPPTAEATVYPEHDNVNVLYDVYTDPSFRGQGLARAVLDRIMEEHGDRDMALRVGPFEYTAWGTYREPKEEKERKKKVKQLKDLYGSYGFKPMKDDPEMAGAWLEEGESKKYPLMYYKAAVQGIPDRNDFGDPSLLQPEQLADLFIQRHLAHRAGEHFDYRIGTPETGLLSWSMKPTELPEPGQKRFVRQQPVHTHQYGDFEGRIGSGYGAGTVRREEKGKVLITKASPTKIEFTTATSGVPERFILLKPEKWGEREWLLINATPKEVIPYEKVRYKKIPASSVEPLIDEMQEGTSVQAKIDGASSLIRLMRNGAEVLSYRVSKKTGRPIVHTERFFGGRPQMEIPKELVGTILKGELYGERQNPTSQPGRAVAEGVDSGPNVPGDSGLDDGRGSGRVIQPQELSGILHSTIAKSLERQKSEGIQLKNMLFDIQQFGKEPVSSDTPYEDRRKMMEQVLQYLPQDRFHVAEQVTDPEGAKALWSQIRDKQHPLTEEGVVIHPPTGKPIKAKNFEESDVYIRSVFPGQGKYHNLGAGGFTYSLDPEGPEVGRVGTGFTDEMRRAMWDDPDSYVGRVARINAMEQLPSGAWRNPSLISLHEDY